MTGEGSRESPLVKGDSSTLRCMTVSVRQLAGPCSVTPIIPSINLPTSRVPLMLSQMMISYTWKGPNSPRMLYGKARWQEADSSQR